MALADEPLYTRIAKLRIECLALFEGRYSRADSSIFDPLVNTEDKMPGILCLDVVGLSLVTME